jgi:hypothetical protein
VWARTAALSSVEGVVGADASSMKCGPGWPGLGPAGSGKRTRRIHGRCHALCIVISH